MSSYEMVFRDLEPHFCLTQLTHVYAMLMLQVPDYSVEDCTFECDFELTATRNDYIHALVAYFDTFFTTGHKTNRFSTGPSAQQTHWKQTVFYLDQEITIVKGEKLKGKLSCKPNSNNRRDLDIAISYKHDGKWQQATGSMEYKMR
jgi:protein arginine N-methyltransferase 1